MFKNYIKIALRSIRNNFTYSAINIFGLSIGLAGFILMAFWVQHELSYDKFNKNVDRLYRVLPKQLGGEEVVFGGGAPPLAQDMKNKLPEIFASSRVLSQISYSFKVGDKLLIEDNGLYADDNFLEMFTYPLVNGNYETDYLQPNSIILTEKLAKKYFGDSDPIGKSILIDNENNYKVTAVMKDVPSNSHLQFDYILPLEPYLKVTDQLENWGRWFYGTYILLNENVSLSALSKKMFEYFKVEDPESDLVLEPQNVADIHLHSRFYNRKGSGDYRLVQLLSIIAILTLVIACVNFINLTTARSAQRAKEVGVRKAIGASRRNLIKQFLGESLLYTSIAALLSLGIIEFFAPVFYEVSGVKFQYSSITSTHIILFAVGLILTVILSGGYPSFLLSKFNPVEVLKIKNSSNNKGGTLRRTLVVGQFSFSLILLIVGLIIYSQIEFIKSKPLGYDKDNIVVIPRTGNLVKEYEGIKNTLLNNTLIKGVTSARQLPTRTTMATPSVDWVGKSNENITMKIALIEAGFIQTTGMKLVEGREFRSAYPIDSLNYILNETAARLISSESVVGKKIRMWGEEGEIIGVVKDFHFESVHNKIKPLIFLLTNFEGYMLVRTQAGKTKESLNYLEEVLEAKNPGHPFEYKFLDGEFQKYFEADERIALIIKIFTTLSLIISTLGMLGLASFSAEVRKKEIGVRKVLGASIYSITTLLSWQFLKLVIISSFIAWPLSYYLADLWLREYAYRIDISLWSFAFGTAATILIAVLTVSYQSIKAAILNPIESIRYE